MYPLVHWVVSYVFCRFCLVYVFSSFCTLHSPSLDPFVGRLQVGKNKGRTWQGGFQVGPLWGALLGEGDIIGGGGGGCWGGLLVGGDRMYRHIMWWNCRLAPRPWLQTDPTFPCSSTQRMASEVLSSPYPKLRPPGGGANAPVVANYTDAQDTLQRVMESREYLESNLDAILRARKDAELYSFIDHITRDA